MSATAGTGTVLQQAQAMTVRPQFAQPFGNVPDIVAQWFLRSDTPGGFNTNGQAPPEANEAFRIAVRNGMLRTSWHVYNTEEDVDRALSALSA